MNSPILGDSKHRLYPPLSSLFPIRLHSHFSLSPTPSPSIYIPFYGFTFHVPYLTTFRLVNSGLCLTIFQSKPLTCIHRHLPNFVLPLLPAPHTHTLSFSLSSLFLSRSHSHSLSSRPKTLLFMFSRDPARPTLALDVEISVFTILLP